MYRSLGMLILMGLITACGDSNKEDSHSAPPVTASDVKDKTNLKLFVLQAKEHLEKDYEKAVNDFRTDEKWKKGSIYLFALKQDGESLFHVAKPSLEGTNIFNLEDKNGVKIVQELLKLSAQKEGGFLEYLWDNPEKEGEDESPKLSYSIQFKGPDGTTHSVGSGFYLE